MDSVVKPAAADDHVPLAEFWMRIGWMAVRLIFVIYLGQQGALFFYQRF
jgi:hypothetical protein